MLLALRQRQRERLELPSLRARGLARQEAAQAPAASGSHRAESGASGGSGRSAHSKLSPEDTLALCTRVLNALLDVGTLHENNEWLTEQLAWRGAARGGAPPEGTALAPGRPLAGLPSSVLPSTGLSSTASPGNGEPSCKEQMEDEGSEFEGDLWI